MTDLQIEYFLAVAENLSFTKTAAEKYVSQPAISRQISAMEEELGVTLFERGYKSTKLTEAGQLFFEFYKKQRQDLLYITQKAREYHNSVRRITLRLGFGSGWAMCAHMPGILEVLGREHPEVTLTIDSYEFQSEVKALSNDEVDVIISLYDSIPGLASLEVHKLTGVPRMLMYSHIHPLARRESLTPADFRDEPFLVPGYVGAAPIVELVKSFCEPYGFVPKIITMKSLESLVANVLNGVGVAIGDAWLLEVYSKNLRHIRLNTDHTAGIAWKRGNKNPALPYFLAELARIFYPGGGCPFAAGEAGPGA